MSEKSSRKKISSAKNSDAGVESNHNTVQTLDIDALIEKLLLENTPEPNGEEADGETNSAQKALDKKWESELKKAKSNGLIFSDDNKTLIKYPEDSKRINLVVPKCVTTIGKEAFADSNLEKITLPDSVTTIDDGAFRSCKCLAMVNIPNSVVKIGCSAFIGCSRLTVNIPDSVKIIGEGAFTYTNGVKVSPENRRFMIYKKESLLDIKAKKILWVSFAFKGVYEIPRGVKEIGEYAFAREYNGFVPNRLKNVIIPDTVTRIGKLAFFNCEISEMIIPDSVTVIEPGAFYKSITQSVKLSNSLTVIGKEGFVASRMKSLTIPSAVNTIEQAAFSSCEYLKDIKLPEGLTTIGADAFRSCERLKDFVIPESVTVIGPRAFAGCDSLRQVKLPSKLEALMEDAFASCPKLKRITIPGSIKTIEEGAVCGIKEIKFDGKNERYKLDQSGALLDTLTGTLLYLAPGFSGEYVVPENITQIGGGAFSYCENLQNVKFHNGVTRIGRFAFRQCTGLKKLTLPDSVSILEEEAFSNSCFETVELPKNLTAITKKLFSEEKKLTSEKTLTSIVIPDSVTEIGEAAFGSCNRLEHIVLPKNLTRIGAHAFACCCELKELELPDNVTEIGEAAFVFCPMQKIKLPTKISCLAKRVFEHTNLTELEIPANISTIELSAFSGNYKLKRIKVDSEKITIRKYAFDSCSELELLEFSDNVKEVIIEKDAFIYCPKLHVVIIPAGCKIDKEKFPKQSNIIER